MQINSKKIIRLISTGILLGYFMVPAALAVNCDQDGDGFIVIPTQVMNTVNPNLQYNEDGDYSPAEWQNYFNIFKNAQLTPDEQCDNMNFDKGAEPKRCDAPIIGPNTKVYNSAIQTSPIQGSSVNPGAIDNPDNGIDENCDGKDATLLATTGQTKDLGGLTNKVLTYLDGAVIFVSIVFMIYGGVMYATAAGDEAKTSKARKAIIGAVIGLLVGLLAPAIVHWIAANLA